MTDIKLDEAHAHAAETTAIGFYCTMPGEIGSEERAASWELLRKEIEKYLPRCIVLPCGRMIVANTSDDLPSVDVPCPCGNPNHWLVRQKVSSEGGQ